MNDAHVNAQIEISYSTLLSRTHTLLSSLFTLDHCILVETGRNQYSSIDIPEPDVTVKLHRIPTLTDAKSVGADEQHQRPGSSFPHLVYISRIVDHLHGSSDALAEMCHWTAWSTIKSILEGTSGVRYGAGALHTGHISFHTAGSDEAIFILPSLGALRHGILNEGVRVAIQLFTPQPLQDRKSAGESIPLSS